MPKLFSPTSEGQGVKVVAPDEIKPLVAGYPGLSKMINRSIKTLERYKAAGRLPPPLRLGASCTWLVSDIELWLSWDCPNEKEFVARKRLARK
jgi:predicted DNA-binding transcriptional regulator AlpA